MGDLSNIELISLNDNDIIGATPLAPLGKLIWPFDVIWHFKYLHKNLLDHRGGFSGVTFEKSLMFIMNIIADMFISNRRLLLLLFESY